MPINIIVHRLLKPVGKQKVIILPTFIIRNDKYDNLCLIIMHRRENYVIFILIVQCRTLYYLILFHLFSQRKVLCVKHMGRDVKAKIIN